MFRYSHYTYCLEKELTHDLKVATHFGLQVSGQFGTENHKPKTYYPN